MARWRYRVSRSPFLFRTLPRRRCRCCSRHPCPLPLMTNKLFAVDTISSPEQAEDGRSMPSVDPELLVMLSSKAGADVSLEGRSPHASTAAALPSLLLPSVASVNAPLMLDAPHLCLLLLRVALKLMGSSFNLVVVRFSLPTCQPPAPRVMS